VPDHQNARPQTVPPVIPVILAGGAGNRLWPLSRQEYPKQLIALLGERSLIQETALRFADRSRFAAPLVVTSEAIRFSIADQLHAVDVTPLSLVLEPVGRGTAPAIAVAALLALEEHPEATIVVAPSDHAIRDLAALQTALDKAVAAARHGLLVTFSIPASRPETGYGYIEQGAAIGGVEGAFKLASFVEKPDATRAAALVADGKHFWNSGMFIFGAAFFLAELERHAPQILAAAKAALAGRKAELDFLRLDAAAFGKSPSDSIDYAVMERTDRAATVPLKAGWTDVGGWAELWAVWDRDKAGNATRGDVVVEDAKNCLVVSDQRLATLVGVENIAVVVTEDAVLVSDLSKAQNVKKLVAKLEEGKRAEIQNHKVVHRPWGFYQGIHEGPNFQVKRITVKPGGRLSLQKHFKRAEHWTVVDGKAVVTVGQKTFELKADQGVYIPLEEVHRLENKTDQPMTLIEVQCGTYLGEDDIVRLEDVYGRQGTTEPAKA